MRSICATCAIALLLASGCALSHQRESGPLPFVADASVRDLGTPTPRDSGPPILAPDAGAPTGCVGFWTSLPSCPASPAAAIGQRCPDEGAECGTGCCQPSPPIACRGGVWVAVPFTADCSTIRCAGPTPCGAGSCAYGRVCVRTEGLRGGDVDTFGACAALPEPARECGDLPASQLGSDPAACTECRCNPAPGVGVQVLLDCLCC